MNKAHVFVAVAAFLVGGILGAFITDKVKQCPDTSEVYERLREKSARVDSLNAAMVHILNDVDQSSERLVRDTITLRIRDRIKWAKAADLDSTAALLFADPL